MSTAVPTIVGLESEFPPRVVDQDEAIGLLLAASGEHSSGADHALRATRVRRRHFVWDALQNLSNTAPPTLADRMGVYETGLREVAATSVRRALIGFDADRVGSFAMTSCTGYVGPTPDHVLARAAGLRSDLRRTFIGHMGCFAAFNGLKVTMDSITARPNEFAMLNCTEFNSLHVRAEELSREQAIVHALFGDASVTAVLAALEPDEGPVALVRAATAHVPDTEDFMTWRMDGQSFVMTLSPFVPLVISEKVGGFVDSLLEPAGLAVGDIDHWVIHPGGPRIVECVGDALGLPDAALRPSLDVLETCGNCSSGTVLLILERLLRSGSTAAGQHGVMMAFGPGLTMEGLLVQFGDASRFDAGAERA